MELFDRLFNRNKNIVGKRAYYSTVDNDYHKVVDYDSSEAVKGIISENGQVYFIVEIKDIVDKE